MIVVFGSINLDIIMAVPRLPRPGQTLLGAARLQPGGKGANQAVAAARDGADVIFAGAVGQDAFAEDALALLAAAHVDMDRIVRHAGATTGLATIATDADGRNHIIVAPGANLRATADQVEDALLAPSTTLLVQMEVSPAQTGALITRARRRQARIILNLAPSVPLPADLLRALDVLVVNEDEAADGARHLGCTNDAAALSNALGITVVRTLGPAGLEAARNGARWAMPAHPVHVVDTVAAGDCLTGVLAAALDAGADLPAALYRANVAAALCCARAGSQGSLPTRADITGALQ